MRAAVVEAAAVEAAVEAAVVQAAVVGFPQQACSSWVVETRTSGT